MDSIHQEIGYDLGRYPSQYAWQSILKEAAGPSTFSFQLHNIHKLQKDFHFGANAALNNPKNANMVLGYKRKLEDTLFHFLASQKGMEVGIDFGRTYSKSQRTNENFSEAQAATLHPFSSFAFDRWSPAERNLFKLGVILGRPSRELVLLYLNNSSFSEEVEEGRTLQGKIHLEHTGSKTVFDAGGTLDLSSTSVLSDRSDLFPLRVLRTDFLIGKHIQPQWFWQLGAAYQKEGQDLKKQGFLALTYKPKSSLTFVTRGGTDFSDRQTQVIAAFGFRYRCCEKFNVYGSVHLDDLVTFGLKSKNFFQGLSFSVKGKLGLLRVLQQKKSRDFVLNWKVSYESSST